MELQGFSEKVELLLEAKGLQKGAFAEKVGVNSSTLSRIFAGTLPKPVTRKKIAAALEVKLEYLMDESAVFRVGDKIPEWAIDKPTQSQKEATLVEIIKEMGAKTDSDLSRVDVEALNKKMEEMKKTLEEILIQIKSNR